MKNTLPFFRHLSAAIFLPCLAAFAFALLAPSTRVQAATQYWNKPAAGLTWSNSGNANWTSTADGSTYTTWVSGNDAVIVTPSAAITFGGSYVTAASLTALDGAAVTHTGSTNTGMRITGANGSSGSGDFSLSENTGSAADLRVFLQSHVAGSSAYAGTITVNAFSSTTSGLYLGADGKTTAAGAAFTGTGTGTRVVLNGGALFLNGGLADLAATLGYLSGSGRIALGNVYSSNSGTRTLRIEQTADTMFTGDIGSRTIDQTNNLLALTKSGSGSLTIKAGEASGYAGTTTVEQGTLRLVGTFGSSSVSGGAVNQGNFVVKAGAILGLDGTFNLGGAKTVTLEDGGVLEAGRLTLDGAGTTTSKGLVFEGTATIRFDLGSGETGSLITLVDSSMTGQSSGTDGSLLFNFSNAGDAEIGTTYDLIQFGSVSSIVLTEYALSQASIDAGWAGEFKYSGDGKTLQFTVTSVGSTIPETGTVALLAGLAALGVAGVVRRLR